MRVYTEPEMDEIRRYHTVEKYLGALVGMGYLLHGSIYLTSVLDPYNDCPHVRESMRSQKAVFAIDVPLIAMWHGTLNKKLASELVRSSGAVCCLHQESGRLVSLVTVYAELSHRDFRFKIDANALKARCDGYIYALPRRGFHHVLPGEYEYYNLYSVFPEAAIPIKKTDFPENKIHVCKPQPLPPGIFAL